MDDEIQSLIRMETLEIVSRKSVSDKNVLPGTWYFNWKRKPDWKISKFKAQYCVIWDIQKRLSPKPLNLYSPVVQWATVRLILILQCIVGFQSQSIDFTHAFDQSYIPSEKPVFIELPRFFESDGEQGDVFLILKKSLYGQAEAARLWYEKFLNCLLWFCDEKGGSLPVHV